jgi:uncharacterized protein
MKVVKSVDVPAGKGAACPLQRGQVLRVVDVKGGQVADFNASSLPDFKEKFWSGRTRILEGAHLTAGGRLWSSPGMEVMFTIIADTVKHRPSPLGGKSHDLLWARCSSQLWRYRDGLENAPNCQDNLARAIEPFGLTVHDVHDAFNIFMKTGLDTQDRLFQEDPESKASDYLELLAQMDCLVAVSACPGQGIRVPGWDHRPLLLQILTTA